ncbi:DUF4249 domain-containing protein [Adhaeribacter rhizoryzae]|uniref:DUF4249 domain-containing protein n=1 Tax=Adhaeribacter rhizoryzae TaxID=2607907 RepID=A0A5M6DT76_9BACT|nr:DUF4249 domain-containing protein [Adhaeribacter rhizoryzae]KAA5548615.1 DUF4249 domain-containing protein [Adhaeribacter rhizoryzae]
MRLFRSKYYIFCLLLALSVLPYGCNMEKNFEVDLPVMASQLVAECYLEPGQPYRLTLTESTNYLAAPEIPLVKEATVIIFYKGQPDTLRYAPFYDKFTRKYYTHVSPTVMAGKPGDTYSLQITDNQGRKLTGTTTVLPVVLLDTVEYTYNDRKKAFLVAKYSDPGNTANYYFFSVQRDSVNNRAEIDYTADDNLSNGKLSAFGTGYDFEKDDTVFVSLYHLEKPYYDFFNSVEGARDANGNPFAQPATVISTVQGGYGVFTNLVYDRKKIILK